MSWLKVCFVVAVAAVAVSAEWEIIQKALETTDLGVGFVSADIGYTGGDQNGVGPTILKTLDGGKNWTQCEAKFGIDLLLLGMAAAGKDVIVTSIFGELYSDNAGQSFQPSVGGGMSQSARFVGVNGDGGHVFGVAGGNPQGQGVALTKNGGISFKGYNAGLFTEARYGAFPTDDIWYCAAGEFPSNNSTQSPLRKTEFMNENGKIIRNYVPPTEPMTDGYAAQITKTEDGGKTWKTVFAENGTFYFNGIDCHPSDPKTCCAVGEASGSADAGARIYCTYDGGESWNRTAYYPSTSSKGYSLIDIRFASDTEAWAIGGELESVAPAAWFLHSTDNGKTWSFKQNPILGWYALALDMVSGSVGYAAVDNLITQSSGIAKYSA